MNVILDIPPKQDKGTWIGLDIEIFGADENLLHLPHTGEFASLQIALPNEDVYIITDVERIAPALKAIDNCLWVGQKLQFDFAHLRKWTSVSDRELLWDCMYIEKTIWGGFFEQFSFSLSDMVRRYFSVYLDKSVREQFIGATELTEEMIYYAAEDALYTLRVGQKQASLLPKDQYENIWQDIDLPATYAFLASKPFRLDREQWEALAIENERLKTEGDALLPFNPRSKQQVRAYWKKAGYEIENSEEATIEDWIEANPNASIMAEAELTLRVKKASTYSRKYGMGFIEKYLFQENDYWVVKPDYFTIGAETGRTSASSPPLQGIPSRDTLVFRECFIARPEHKLVVADYSAQEPCIAAYISKDKALIDLVNSGEDIYLVTGQHIYSTLAENKKNRKKTKDALLGTTYGLTPTGLARRWGGTVADAKDFIQTAQKPYPQLRKYLETISKRRDFVKTVVGRKIWLNEHSWQAGNNAKNGPMQGTAADMMKKALVAMRKNWRKEWGNYHDPTAWDLVACVHDEAVTDVLEEHAQTVATYMDRVMREIGMEMCPGILFRVETHICDNWGQAKL